jgi:hypothetical protein
MDTRTQTPTPVSTFEGPSTTGLEIPNVTIDVSLSTERRLLGKRASANSLRSFVRDN